ncbi:hypothetical protein FACS1894216_17710 [Synergistales bacterium]|nr:hypothetical protein FACS1894216_17710 [Synergistales bacterium]
MSKTIGIVSEGPTDYLLVKELIDKITREENDYLPLQPEEPPTGPLGNGWKGVWRWCDEHRAILNDYMTAVSPPLDCLIIQMDGDVSRKEKETHCMCVSALCEISGTVHPLDCQLCSGGVCPVRLPCTNHGDSDFAGHLSELVFTWLHIAEGDFNVIMTVPCDSTDTWVATAYDDLRNNCEAHTNPWTTIIARAAEYHSIRIPGHKKSVKIYRELVKEVCKQWNTVKERCPQAAAFDAAVKSSLLLQVNEF